MRERDEWMYECGWGMQRMYETIMYIYVFHPIYYPRIMLALPPSSSSDPEGFSSPLPTTVRAFIFIARRIIGIKYFLPSRRLASNCAYPRC